MNNITEIDGLKQIISEKLQAAEDITNGKLYELLTAFYDVTTGSNAAREELLKVIKSRAAELNASAECEKIINSFESEYRQQQIKSRITNLIAVPRKVPEEYETILTLYQCRGYVVDTSIYEVSTSRSGETVLSPICPQFAVIVARLINESSDNEKVKILFCDFGTWKTIITEKETVLNSRKITALADKGLLLTNETAKKLTAYFYAILQQNADIIPCVTSFSHIGLCEKDSIKAYLPYNTKDFVCDSANEFNKLYKAIHKKGSFEKWLEQCTEIRQSIYIRLVMAASFASVLISELDLTPFITHLWGKTGTGKTVALKVAASIWGNAENYVKSLNTTEYGAAETAAFLYSFPCILDELQTLRDSNISYNQFVMRLCEGISRTQGAARGGIREMKQWKCSFITSGEENLVKSNSGGGTVNRVLSLEVPNNGIVDGKQTMRVINNNYGHAGEEFLKHIPSETELQKLYDEKENDIKNSIDSTGKQCMAMAVLLVADDLAVKHIFKGETPLTAAEVKQFIATKKEVDIVNRCYEWLCNWVAYNRNRFEHFSVNNGEIWGEIRNDCTMINKAVLCKHMTAAGFDFDAVKKRLAERGYIGRNSQGRLVCNTRVYGVKACYIRLLQSDFEELDETYKEECPW